MVDIRRPVSFDQVEKVNYDWIVEKTRNKEFGYIPAGSLNVEIELLVIYKSYACVKLTSPGGTEYLHLRYFNPNWYIVNGIWERNASVTTGVRQNEQVTPGAFQLSQNYPNPFNPSTTIQYTLQEPGNVVLKIFNLIGEEVDILVEGFQSTGNYQVKWQPQAHASGIYLYQLQVGEFIQAKKLIFQR